MRRKALQITFFSFFLLCLQFIKVLAILSSLNISSRPSDTAYFSDVKAGFSHWEPALSVFYPWPAFLTNFFFVILKNI